MPAASGALPPPEVPVRSLSVSLLAVVVVVALAWLAASLAGFRFMLLPSLVASVALTVLLNLALRAVSGRSRR